MPEAKLPSCLPPRANDEAVVEDLKDSSVGESVKAAGAAEEPAGSAPPVRYRRLVEVATRKLGLTID